MARARELLGFWGRVATLRRLKPWWAALQQLLKALGLAG